MRSVLLVDPITASHSLLYYKAALASTGFEETQFTLATLVRDEADRVRLEQFAREERRFRLRILGAMRGRGVARWESWREFARVVDAVEKLLKQALFEQVVYLYLDLALPFFGIWPLRRRLASHAQANLAGLIFRDNGLRQRPVSSVKAIVRSRVDRAILKRGLTFPGLRKIAFLDHWCADRARSSFDCRKCGYGVDPVFFHTCDAGAARAQLGLKPEDFVFLLFGTMSDRKAIVESLAYLRAAQLPSEQTVIIVAGPCGEDYRERVAREVALTRSRARVIHHDRFIEQKDVAQYFAASDTVVCVYRDFTGSSSVLLHGAYYGKTAIVAPGGVMEDAVRRHGFGEVISIEDKKGFIKAVRRLARLDPGSRREMATRARAYGQSMDARNFMAQFQ